MTQDEFKQFRELLCDPLDSAIPGYYPQMPFNGRMAALWYRTLQRYDLARVIRALEIYAAAEPSRVPSLDAMVERVKALQPVGVTAWQQFPPDQVQAMRDEGYGGVLRSLLPAPGGNAWAKCWIWLFEQGFAKPGREAEMAAECRRFADEYPADATDWLRHAARLYNEAGEAPPQPSPPSRVGALRQVSTPMGARAPVPAMGQGNHDEEDGEVF